MKSYFDLFPSTMRRKEQTMKCCDNYGHYMMTSAHIKSKDEQMMSREEALEAWRQMYSEINKDNWLFVGTINPQMVVWAIKALEGVEDGNK